MQYIYYAAQYCFRFTPPNIVVSRLKERWVILFDSRNYPSLFSTACLNIPMWVVGTKSFRDCDEQDDVEIGKSSRLYEMANRAKASGGAPPFDSLHNE